MSNEYLKLLEMKKTAYNWIKEQGFEPISKYGYRVSVMIDGKYKNYKNFAKAATAQKEKR